MRVIVNRKNKIVGLIKSGTGRTGDIIAYGHKSKNSRYVPHGLGIIADVGRGVLPNKINTIIPTYNGFTGLLITSKRNHKCQITKITEEDAGHYLQGPCRISANQKDLP